MNHAYRTTLLMLIIAAAAAGAAAAVYPWPQPVVISEAVNKPLFEDFNTSNVRSIRIETFNNDRNEIERLLIRRKGEKWLLPTHNNFVADNGPQLGAATNLLLDKTVLEKRSDTQEDHIKYGVVDPAAANSSVNRSSLGKKISLSDRNNKELASLIVGLPLKNDPKKLKHYVRIPGQPSVYVVDIDPRAINPDFRAWVNPNLLRLTKSTGIERIEVESYRLDPNDIANAKREWVYQSNISVGDKKVDIKLEVADSQGQLSQTEPTVAQQRTLQTAAGSIAGIVFSDVQAKNKSTWKALRTPSAKTKPADFESTQPYGFRVQGFENESWQFEATGGSIRVQTTDGVIVTILVGAIDSEPRNSSLKLNHYLMLIAGFDSSLIPEPEKPAAGTTDEKKAYLRKVAQRENQLKLGRQRATELNESFAKWYYVVSEDVVARLRPELGSDAP